MRRCDLASGPTSSASARATRPRRSGRSASATAPGPAGPRPPRHRNRLAVKALQAGREHRTVDLVQEPSSDVHDPAGSMPSRLRSYARWWIAQSAIPLTTAAMPSGLRSSMM